jgi:hypothetical protein
MGQNGISWVKLAVKAAEVFQVAVVLVLLGRPLALERKRNVNFDTVEWHARQAELPDMVSSWYVLSSGL